MISSFSHKNSINWVFFSIVFCLGFQFCSSIDQTMKIHPVPKKRNITFRYDMMNSTLSEANRVVNRQKKLRRLPHIFSKVLELPFNSDADVLIEENPDCFRFIVNTDEVGEDVYAHTIQIYPGVTKIVIRGSNVLEWNLDDLEFDLWRFRLPPSTKPELASANYVDGELVVIVPKGLNSDDGNDDDDEDDEEQVWVDDDDDDGNGDLRGSVDRLVLVQ